jgi:transcriptional regulator with XRE-family HTH domain
MNLPYELEHFAAAVRSGRNALGWAQKDLAMYAGVSLPTIARIETGGNPQATTLLQLIKLFETRGIEFDWRPDGFKMETIFLVS